MPQNGPKSKASGPRFRRPEACGHPKSRLYKQSPRRNNSETETATFEASGVRNHPWPGAESNHKRPASLLPRFDQEPLASIRRAQLPARVPTDSRCPPPTRGGEPVAGQGVVRLVGRTFPTFH
jgi:hypothetical protein